MIDAAGVRHALISSGLCRAEDIAGFSIEEIASLEREAGLIFPPSYRAFLAAAGLRAGRYFAGTDMFGAGILELTAEARDLLKYNNEALDLPPDAFAFQMHQGYAFCYFIVSEGEDPPVHQYVEGQGHFRGVWPSVSEFLVQTIEQDARNWRELDGSASGGVLDKLQKWLGRGARRRQ